MKHIILCEGQNDSIFFDELLEPKRSELCFVERTKLKNPGDESRKVGDFLSDDFYFGNKNYLIKDEGGKDKVVYFFKKFLQQFGFYGQQLLILGVRDTDNDDKNDIFNAIKNKIRENKLDFREIVGKYHIILTSSENRRYILFVVPKTLEKEVERVFGKVTKENIRKLAKENIDWINELKNIVC